MAAAFLALVLLLVLGAPARAALEDEPLRPLAGGGLVAPAEGVPAGEADLGTITDGAADDRGGVVLLSARGLWRVDPDGFLVAVPRPEGAGRALDLAAGPDGDVLALFARTESVWRLSPDGEAPERTVGLPFPGHRLASLSNGDVAVSSRGAVARIGPDGGHIVLAVEDPGLLAATPDGGFVVVSGRRTLRRFAFDGTSRRVSLGRLALWSVTGLATGPTGELLVAGSRRLDAGDPPVQLLLRGGGAFQPDTRAFSAANGRRTALRRRVIRVGPDGGKPDVLSEGAVGAMFGPGHGVTIDEAAEQPRALAAAEADGTLVLAGTEVWQAGGDNRPAAWLTQRGYERLGAGALEVETTTAGRLTATVRKGDAIVARTVLTVRRAAVVEFGLDRPLPSGVLHLTLRLETEGGRVGASGTRLWRAPAPSLGAARRFAERIATRSGGGAAATACAQRAAARFVCDWLPERRLGLTAREDGWLLDVLSR